MIIDVIRSEIRRVLTESTSGAHGNEMCVEIMSDHIAMIIDYVIEILEQAGPRGITVSSLDYRIDSFIDSLDMLDIKTLVADRLEDSPYDLEPEEAQTKADEKIRDVYRFDLHRVCLTGCIEDVTYGSHFRLVSMSEDDKGVLHAEIGRNIDLDYLRERVPRIARRYMINLMR